ncbi:MAG: ABC transporter permease [Vicinamibacterales bacterium]
MLLHDVRLAVRGLARRPAFAAAAILLLALGAGANAAVFSVVRGVVLRPLPFASPERLVAVWPGEYVSNEDIGFWRDRASSLPAVAGMATGWLMALGAEGGEPLKVTGNRVSDNFFEVLGTTAALGRPLAPGDGTVGRERVTVLADGLWRRRFGADPSVIGRSVQIDQVAHEVVGVMAPGFEVLGERADLWVPLPFGPGTPAQRTTMSLAIARLRDGTTAAAASNEVAALVPEMRRILGKADDWGRTIRVVSLQDSTTTAVRPALTLLLAAVGLVLLLGAANLGTLVLGRSIERARELAVRTAVGASRRQLLRQLLVEQIVLATAGALAGVALARALLPVLVSRLPAEVPRQTEIVLDGTVFAAALAASVGLAVAMAVLPAIVALRPGLQPLLRQHQSTDTPGRQRALGGLVAAQVALAVVLGIGAGLMLRSMWHLQQVDPGFDADGLLAFRLQTTSKYRALSTGLPYLQQVGDRLAALPGVTAVGAIGHLPMSGYAWTIGVHRPDQPPPPGASAPLAGWRFIWGDYLAAMRIPVIAGRAFNAADVTTGAPVALVNETLARTTFGRPEAALGQRLVQRGGGREGETVVEIVGVIGDVRHDGLDTPPRPEFYRPLTQTFMFPMHLVVRSAGEPAALAGAVRRAVYDVDPAVPVADLQTMPAVLAGTLGRPRLLTTLLGVFAATGLLLSVVGLYGVVAVRVRQREREIGIRMALGASADAMAGAVVRHGLGQAAAGLALGLPAAFGLARFMESVVYGVTTRDPLTFATLPLLLAAVAAAACWLPARRAARVDPVVAITADSR